MNIYVITLIIAIVAFGLVIALLISGISDANDMPEDFEN